MSTFFKFLFILFQLICFTPDACSITLVKRNDSILDCIPDDGDDTRIQKYIWTKNGDAIHTPRKLYTSSGSLVFETIDEETEGMYQCYAETYLGVESSNSIYVRAPPTTFAPELEPTNVTASVNEPLHLSCKLPNGWPERVVTWGQMDSTGVFYPLNDSRVTVDQNGTLYFSYVEMPDTSRDGTNYVCAVSSRFVNEITVGCRTILRIDETNWYSMYSPTLQFVSPENVSVAINGTISLYCVYGGMPTPEIDWRRESHSLSHSRVLTINNVTEKDAGLYVCLVDHYHFTQYHTFYLDVLVPPSFVEEPANERMIENSSVEIKCNASGWPQPNILWTLNGQPIDEAPYNSRRIVSRDNTSIRIENLTPEDSGYYACNATNVIGYVFKDISVQVFEKTRIQRNKGLLDQVVTHGSRARFHCEAKTGDARYLSFSWKENDVKLTENSSSDFLIEYGYNFSLLTIRNASISRPLTRYTCVATTPWDQDSVDVLLIVKDRPSSPLITELDCAAQWRKAKIRWKWTKDNGEPITHYVIQCNNGFMPDRWETVYDNISAFAQSAYIPMKPWGNYTFRVLAANAIGVSLPSDPTIIECRVGEEVPRTNPRNVAVEGTEPDKLAIKWTPLDQTELFGPGFYYEVSWKIRLANVSWEVHNVTNWNESAFIVTAGVPPYREYSAKVVSFNEVGQSDEEVTVYTGFSHEGVPLMAPTNLTLAENASATSATISWSAVTDDSVQGNFIGYKIEMGSKHYLDTMDLVPAYELSKTVNNLIPDTRYEVRVYACNVKYCSLPSETLIFVTAEGAPDEVQDLQVERLGSTAFLLSWKRPKETHGVLTSYKVYCEKVRRHIREPVPYYNFSRVVEPHRTRLKLANLTTETTYRMVVVALTRAGEGIPTSVEEQTGGMSIAPRLMNPDFRVEYAVSNNEPVAKATISILWLPCGNRKCDVRGTAATGFYVKYRKQNEASFQRTSLQSDEDFQLIENLVPFTMYYIKVVSVDDDGLEAESHIQSIHVVLADASQYDRGSHQRTGLIALIAIVVLSSLCLMAFFMVSSCRIKRETYGRYDISPELLL